MLLILVLNGILNFWNLGINGWANYFYSSAVQSGTQDLGSAFFGSSDWGNSITVDKPPLSLWVMEISTKMFGFTPIGILAPQAIMGVISTLLIYVIIRKNFSAIPALFAAAVFFTTPIVVLMSRYNNPDPLMLLLMLVSVHAVQHAIESNRLRYLILTGVAVGLAFMTKQLQGLLVLPSVSAAYLFWGNAAWSTRLKNSAISGAVMVFTGGFWMTVVDLIPAGVRPYVGGSQSNSMLELTLAYNGLDRIVGTDANPVANLIPEQFRQVDSDAGLTRLLNANYGQEIGWMLPAAIIGALLTAFGWKLLPRKGGARTLAFMAITWFLGTYLVLSFMGNQIHTYYTEALSAPLALTLGVASAIYVQHHQLFVVRAVAAAGILATAMCTWLILSSVVGWPEWLGNGIMLLGALGAALSVVRPPARWLEVGAASVAVVAMLAGPLLTSALNTALPQNGSNPVSGQLTKSPTSINRFLDDMKHGNPAWAYDVAFGQKPNTAILDRLTTASRTCLWAAATSASQTAARLQLEVARPVMPLGGFAGSDPSPTLQAFKDKVAGGQICYFLPQDEFLATQPKASTVAEISDWVKTHFQLEMVGGQGIYDLSKPIA
ncbi:glycosyltransferase family 39 protein [Pseudarthrobacter sp. AG30]|uniref:ArnT family glycosyltransferase n=1 Tax=Pseudarthrobacter sp. AG30 TaxID=2249742 RepID=UPI001058068A|nr:glycosyltransferase family 39 protein [Pseudarthrobacter sp. AG30]